MRKLRAAAWASFLAGPVLYLGWRSYACEERLHALPVDRIWKT